MRKKIFLLILSIITFDYSENTFEEEKCNVYKMGFVDELSTIEIINNVSFGRNSLSVTENKAYVLNFTNLTYDENENDLLIYTDLHTVQDNISQFDIFNETKIITFNTYAKKSGFIDVELVKKNEYQINKNTIRENFYQGNIIMKTNKVETQFYINIIPTDNNSDLYFFQTNISSVRDDNRDKMNLYYFNDFENKNLKEIINYIKGNPMKRERNINGKVEIFGYDYKNLDKDFYISKAYTQIKGDGTLGPILSLSILFAALVVVTAIFIKNTYCDTGYKNKMSSNMDE